MFLVKGPGSTQRFVLRELSALPEDEWMLVSDLIKRFSEHENKPITISLDRNVRNAYHRLLSGVEPKVEQGWINGRLRVKLTWFGRAYQTDPWALKERDMAGVWNAIQAEQIRETRKTKRR